MLRPAGNPPVGPRLAAVAGPLEGVIASIDEEVSGGRGIGNRLAIDDPSIAERRALSDMRANGSLSG